MTSTAITAASTVKIRIEITAAASATGKDAKDPQDFVFPDDLPCAGKRFSKVEIHFDLLDRQSKIVNLQSSIVNLKS
ncbi:MAG: hypothetical protein B6D38_11750 [Anaerolineae bacterium UTCFX1]|nr:MAG: hypothetical protein B6D38_11750 [Anaerolineae bacterium UTCFX1]